MAPWRPSLLVTVLHHGLSYTHPRDGWAHKVQDGGFVIVQLEQYCSDLGTSQLLQRQGAQDPAFRKASVASQAEGGRQHNILHNLAAPCLPTI